MIPLIIWTLAWLAWLLYETDYMRVRLLVGKEYFMILPSGTGITEEDYNYLVSIIKPKKQKANDQKPCWYCLNGHDREHIDLGLMSYDLCECGASIIDLPNRRVRKSLPYAAMAREIGARFAPYQQANLKRMRKLC